MTEPTRPSDRVVAWSAQLQPSDHLIVLLHGFGADQHDLLPLAPHLPVRTVVACPQAPVGLPGGGRAWYPLQLDQSGVVDAPGYGDAAAEQARALLQWVGTQQASRISIGGFSQGASVALAAMAQDPGAATDWLVLSGFAVPTGSEATAPQELPQVFWGRGDADPVIPQRWIALTEAWLADRAALTARVYGGLGHSIDARELADLNGFLGRSAGPVDPAGTTSVEHHE